MIKASGQERFYIFIQSETPESFFVKKENKIFNSAPGGYIILPGLANVKHEFSIGFTNSSETEQFFDLQLKGKDRSFLLKKFDNKIWGLYDLQDLTITHALKSELGFQLKPSQEVSSFTTLLIKASGDSSLKYTAVIANKETPEQVKNDPALTANNANTNTIKPVQPGSSESTINATNSVEPGITNQKDSLIVIVKNEPPNKQNIIEPIASTKEVENEIEKKEIGRINSGLDKENDFKPNQVSKISENLTQKGLGIVYKDILPGGKTDTISIVIDDLEEIKKPVIAKQDEKIEVIRHEKQSTEEIITKANTKDEQIAKTANPEKEDPKETITSKVLKFLNISTKNETNDKDNQLESDIDSKTTNKEKLSGCNENLSDKELVKLRNKMALAVTDESMIGEGESVLKNKCITSSQVKRLSELFGTNAGKFSFFKSVYPSVSDKQYFYTLQEQLTDEHYNSRFNDILQSK